MQIEQGEIYWIPLTGSGSVQNGRRPCIVMSRGSVNRSGNTVVVVPMSSKTGKANPYYRILLPAGEIIKDPSSSSEIKDSIAMCDHLRVVDKSQLEARIGKLTYSAIIAVELGIAFVFDIR